MGYKGYLPFQEVSVTYLPVYQKNNPDNNQLLKDDNDSMVISICKDNSEISEKIESFG